VRDIRGRLRGIRTRSESPTTKSEGMKFKDWMTISLSSMALIVSLNTALFSVVQQVDDVRFAPRGQTILSLDTKNKQIVIEMNGLGMTFINLGNRPASVISAGVSLALRDEGGLPLDCGRLEWDLSLEPIILKASEMASKDINRNEKISYKCRADKIPDKGTVEAIVRFYIITPDVNLAPAYWNMAMLHFDQSLINGQRVDVFTYEKAQGISLTSGTHSTVLYRNWSTVFKYLLQPWTIENPFSSWPTPPPPPPPPEPIK